jgi:hypothetical protein
MVDHPRAVVCRKALRQAVESAPIAPADHLEQRKLKYG